MAEEGMTQGAATSSESSKGMDSKTKKYLIGIIVALVVLFIFGIIIVFVIRSQDPVSNSIRAIFISENATPTPTPAESTPTPTTTPTPTQDPEPTDEPEPTPTTEPEPTEDPEPTPTDEPSEPTPTGPDEIVSP